MLAHDPLATRMVVLPGESPREGDAAHRGLSMACITSRAFADGARFTGLAHDKDGEAKVFAALGVRPCWGSASSIRRPEGKQFDACPNAISRPSDATSIRNMRTSA
jgi:hypothetical protein